MTRPSRRLWLDRFSPPQLIALSFAVAILALPVTHEPGVRVAFLQALFTATSATSRTSSTSLNLLGSVTVTSRNSTGSPPGR